MDSDSIHALRTAQLDSYGRLLAGFSHEMKNHLGVIRESSGLLQDLVGLHQGQMDEQIRARMEKATSLIEERVVITAAMLHHLSGFAHRSDAACSSFQPGQLVEELCMFLGRFARLNKCELSWRSAPESVAIYNDPSLLHHLLYRLFLLCQERMAPGGQLCIETGASKGQALIRFICKDGQEGRLSQPEQLRLPLEMLQGSLSIFQEDGGLELQLHIPSRAA
nr:hypothetical protein [uncultured Desulfobulbus sp.]